MTKKTKETWKKIKEYPDYQISNLGKVRTIKNGKEELLKLHRIGYRYKHWLTDRSYFSYRFNAGELTEKTTVCPVCGNPMVYSHCYEADYTLGYKESEEHYFKCSCCGMLAVNSNYMSNTLNHVCFLLKES